MTLNIIASKKFLAATATAFALIAMHGTASAFATIPVPTQVYNFSGTCSDCAGTATAQLILRNYIAGDNLSLSNLVSFSYDGTNLFDAYTIDPSMSGAYIYGHIAASAGPQDDLLFISTSSYAATQTTPKVLGYSFGLLEDKSWYTGYSPIAAGQVVTADEGINGHFSVPEPGTMALTVLGLLGLATLRRQLSA
jgi:hypothetical protein